MLRLLLAVKQNYAAQAQQLCQGLEADAGSLGHGMEHGFAVKDPPYGNAVEASCQLSVKPGFHGVGKAEAEHAVVRYAHVLCEPGLVAVCTAFKDLVKDRVQGNGKIHGSLFSGGTFREMILFRQHHAARCQSPPAYLVPRGKPWEDALGIGGQQVGSGKEAAIAEIAVFPGSACRRKACGAGVYQRYENGIVYIFRQSDFFEGMFFLGIVFSGFSCPAAALLHDWPLQPD